MKEKISIVMPVYNQAKVIPKIIDSYCKEVIEKLPGSEFIVAEDGSTDGTKQMLWEKFQNNKKVVVLNQHRSFPCKARNNGIRKAKFEFVVIMDDDCIPSRNWLKNLIDGFNSEKIGVVSSFDLYGGTSTAFRKSVLEKVLKKIKRKFDLKQKKMPKIIRWIPICRYLQQVPIWKIFTNLVHAMSSIVS